MKNLSDEKIKSAVLKSYKSIAISNGASESCCNNKTLTIKNSPVDISSKIGYSMKELESAPKESNMGLGCGNPQLIANIKEGETVLDLGCGAGFDCFLAADKVGDKGMIIGVDMTFEMLKKARATSRRNRYKNVDFRLGEIENLPVENAIVDVIISNCVINLSTNKQRVYNEAYRALKKGGRIAISDIVIMKELTEEMKNDEKLYCGWVTGASSVEELEAYLHEAGFEDITIDVKEVPKEYEEKWGHNLKVGEYIMSAAVKAVKK